MSKPTATTTYTLLHPIEVSGASVGVVTVRRPKVRDLEVMERAGSSPMARSVALLVNLCELPPDTIRDLDGEDFTNLDVLVMGMLGKLQSRP